MTSSAEQYYREWKAKGYLATHIPKQYDTATPVAGHAATPYSDAPVKLPARGAAEQYFSESVQKIFSQSQALLLRKHADYGPGNIADAPGGALYGLQVRIHDKVARINHLLDKGVGPENESLEDSFVDLANYALIAVLVLRKQWPA